MGVDARSNTADGIIIIIIKKNPTDAITAEYMDLKCQNGPRLRCGAASARSSTSAVIPQQRLFV